MRISKAKIYELEKELIRKRKALRGIKPMPIKIIYRNVDYYGRASSKYLEISSEFLKRISKTEQLKDLLLHELVHYANCEDIHGLRFIRIAKQVGSTVGQYELGKCIEELRGTGQTKEILNKDGTITFTFNRKPNWKTFYNDAIYNTVDTGRLFKSLRKKYKLSLKEVAKRVGISPNYLRKIENNIKIYHPYWRMKTVVFSPISPILTQALSKNGKIVTLKILWNEDEKFMKKLFLAITKEKKK